MSEKNINWKNESEIKIDVQNQPKFAKIHKLDVLFAKDKINAKSHDEHECYWWNHWENPTHPWDKRTWFRPQWKWQ